MRRTLQIAAIATIFVLGWRYCSSRPAKVPAKMRALWESPCRGPGAGHVAPWRVYVDSRAELWVIHYILYRDAACSKPISNSRAIGEIKLTRRGSNTFDIDTKHKSFFHVCLDKLCAISAETLKIFSYSDWEVNKEHNVTGRSVAPRTFVLAAGAMQYDIVRLDSGLLNYGDNQTGDTVTAATRPREFEDASLRYKRIPELPEYLLQVQAP